jgi:hypothetical protein
MKRILLLAALSVPISAQQLTPQQWQSDFVHAPGALEEPNILRNSRG